MDKKYPMTYEEYKIKVIELFLERYPVDKQEIMISRLNNYLKEDHYFIKGLYNDTCFDYDHPEIYGDVSKKSFEDYHLESVPVNALHMLLGGSFG